jgi:ssDNA-binding replication factor A large subunit
MKLSDISDGATVDEAEFEIVDKSEPRVVTSQRGEELDVCDAVAQDDTDEINLTLWEDEIERFEVGDRARIKDGWAKDFDGGLQLSSGRYGELEKL